MNTRSDAGARCRLGLDTPAEELLNELPENAARISAFFGRLMAAREDGLVELSGMCRVSTFQSKDDPETEFDSNTG